MTDEDIYYSEARDQYYIYNETGHPLFFDSSLEANDALRDMEIRQAIADEVELIAAYFRKAGMTRIAASIEAKEYKNAG